MANKVDHRAFQQELNRLCGVPLRRVDINEVSDMLSLIQPSEVQLGDFRPLFQLSQRMIKCLRKTATDSRLGLQQLLSINEVLEARLATSEERVSQLEKSLVHGNTSITALKRLDLSASVLNLPGQNALARTLAAPTHVHRRTSSDTSLPPPKSSAFTIIAEYRAFEDAAKVIQKYWRGAVTRMRFQQFLVKMLEAPGDAPVPTFKG